MVFISLARPIGGFNIIILTRPTRVLVTRSMHITRRIRRRKSGPLACCPATMIRAYLVGREHMSFHAITVLHIVKAGQGLLAAIPIGSRSQVSTSGLRER